MDNELSRGDIEEMIKCLRFKYPRIDVQVTLSSFEIGLDSDLLVLCRLRRYSGNPNKIYSPKWYKPKLEGWIIVVAMHDSDELMAMKRVRVQRSWRTTKIKVHIPETVREIPGYDERKKEIIFDVYILSDAYLGLDQFYTITCNLDIHRQSREIRGYGGSKFEKSSKARRAMYDDDDDASSVTSAMTFASRKEQRENRKRERDRKFGRNPKPINEADLEYKDDLMDDPLFNLETADDLIGLKNAVSSSSGSDDNDIQHQEHKTQMTRARSVLSGATFDTTLLDPRNRPQENVNLYGTAAPSDGTNLGDRIEIDFDDLRSVVTDITDSDAQTVMTNVSNIKRWD